jgi:uncharacterized protein YecE (DUF72 family)
MRIHVGTAGWSYTDWKGTVYPEPRPRGFDELVYLAGYLDVLEINSSFYRPPTPKAASSWVRRIEALEDFRFTAKLWQGFTHERDAAWSEKDARVFLEGIGPIEEAGRLGALLLQFPWFFRNEEDSRDRLRRIADRFRDPDRRLVVEVRDRSWTTPEGLDFLRDLGLSVCSVDMPLARATVRPDLFEDASIVYLRLHGRNATAWFDRGAGRDAKYDYLYAPGELDEWLERLRRMRGTPESLVVIANNHFRGQAPCNALQLKAKLTGRKVRVPEALLETYPGLREVAE